MKFIFNFAILLNSVFIVGCYTQFVTLESRVNTITNTNAVDSTITSEEKVENKIDTIIIRDREVCYWQRTFFGDMELVCYKTNYSDFWYSYYNRPWWYHQSFLNKYDCHCPYHISFHPNCRNCWFHCDNINNLNHYKFKHIFINKKIKPNPNTGIINPNTNTSTTTKSKIKGAGKSGGRIKKGTTFVGQKPKNESTSHIPNIPEKLIKKTQKTSVNNSKKPEDLLTGNKNGDIMIDTTSIDSSMQKPILLNPKAVKHRSKRKRK